MTDSGVSNLPKGKPDYSKMKKREPPRLRELSEYEENQIATTYYFLVKRIFEE